MYSLPTNILYVDTTDIHTPCHISYSIFNYKKLPQAVINKILMEMTLLDPNLQLSAETLVKSLEREKPWDARVIISENSSITLDSFLFQACASGATTFAWWIWHSGGSAVSQNKDKRTPLHAALASRHLDTAINLVLHMGANLFLPDNKGKTPLDLIPVDVTRRQVLKVC